MKPKILPLEEFKRIYQKVPRLCVDLVIENNDGVLLSKRAIEPYKGQWHLPGGTILFTEKVKDTVKRVAKEETGLNLKIVKFLGFIEYPILNPRGQTITLVFLVKPVSGTLKGGSQGEEIKFFKRLPKNTLPEQANFLKENDLMN